MNILMLYYNRFNRFRNPMMAQTRTEQLFFGVCIGRRNQQCPSPTLSGVSNTDTAPILLGIQNPRNNQESNSVGLVAKEGARCATTTCLAQCNLVTQVGVSTRRNEGSVAQGTPCTRDTKLTVQNSLYKFEYAMPFPILTGGGWTIFWLESITKFGVCRSWF